VIEAESENGWEIELLHGNGFTHLNDNNQNNIPDTGELTAFGGQGDIMLVLRIPVDAVAYTVDTITLSASSTLSDTYSIELKANIERIYNVDMALESGDLIVTSGETLVYTIKITNMGNYQENLDIRFTELPSGWQAELSDDKPLVPIDGSGVVAVDINVPSDYEPGDYLVTMKATSDDGTPASELSLTIEVRQKDEGFAVPFLFLIILLFIVIAIIALAILTRRREEEGMVEDEETKALEVPESMIPVEETGIDEEEIEYEAPVPPPIEFEGPMFPSIEIITCPVCYHSFEEEIVQRPYRVLCPACGATGTVR
jgi:uncharacterized repeat protein (TIGR01451 family)